MSSLSQCSYLLIEHRYGVAVEYAMRLGNHALASDLAGKEVELKRTIFGDDHPDTQGVQRRLGRIKRPQISTGRLIEDPGGDHGLEDPFGPHTGLDAGRGRTVGAVEGFVEAGSESGHSANADRDGDTAIE